MCGCVSWQGLGSDFHCSCVVLCFYCVAYVEPHTEENLRRCCHAASTTPALVIAAKQHVVSVLHKLFLAAQVAIVWACCMRTCGLAEAIFKVVCKLRWVLGASCGEIQP